jgi:outer membrane protein OmpA-like peptidoglycan-associated protein
MTLRLASIAIAASLGGALFGCASTDPAPPPPAPVAATAPPVAAPAPPPPLVAAPFPDAVARAGKRLFADAAQRLGDEPRTLIVDPLIDASSGQQTLASTEMGKWLAQSVQASHPNWSVKDFNRSTLAATPLLLIGTLTAIHTKPDSDSPADAFRICLRLVDLKTGRVVAKGLDRATVDTVNAEPLPVFRDSPTWHKDKTVNAYIKSCQGTPNVGDSVDPTYLLRLPAAAVLNEAQLAYGEKRLADANRLFKEASAIAEPDDLRVLNGLYLTSWRLGKQRDATEAFRKIVAQGMATRQLPLKLFFSPGKALPITLPELQQQYTMWLREVAQVSDAEGACLRVVGHTSRTGVASINDTLSSLRATFVKERLERNSAKLRGRVASEGMGSRENLIGLATDDLRDALDRRVEFKVIDCAGVRPKG